MRKNLTLLLFTFVTITNAQYFEDFEKGVPGSMIQKYEKGQTTWINFGLSALGVDKPLAETNSAVFFDGMALQQVETILQTPILNFSTANLVLEFKYLQKLKSKDYFNTLFVDFSNDGGVTWQQLMTTKNTSGKLKIFKIDLESFKPTNKTVVRFKSQQDNCLAGSPIVIDDISIAEKEQTKEFATIETKPTAAVVEVSIYPNPSTGLFNVRAMLPFAVAVYDTNGRIIFTRNYAENTAVIDLGAFTKGIYIAQITTTEKTETKKLVIN